MRLLPDRIEEKALNVGRRAEAVAGTVQRWLGNSVSHSLLKLATGRTDRGNRLNLALKRSLGEDVPEGLDLRSRLASLLAGFAVERGAEAFGVAPERMEESLSSSGGLDHGDPNFRFPKNDTSEDRGTLTKEEPVSAVVTTLNEEKYIASCLDSIVNQTVKPGEIIVIDAESTDRTREIVRDFPAEIITVDFHGILKSKDRGFREAENNLVLCVDGDTVLSKTFLEKSLEAIGDHDVACGKMEPCDPNLFTEIMAKVQRLPPEYLSGPAYLMRKEAYFSWKERYWDENLPEVPLNDFDHVEEEEMIAKTELPSRKQKRWGEASVIGCVLLGAAVIRPSWIAPLSLPASLWLFERYGETVKSSFRLSGFHAEVRLKDLIPLNGG